MVRANSDVCDSEKLLLVPHSEVTEIRSKPYEHKLNRDAVIVAVDNCGIRINVRLPASSLQIDSECVRRDVTEDFVLRKLASDENHG